MEIKKPVTENMKRKCNDFYKYMYWKHDYVTKDELMRVFKIGNERTVRDVISEMSKRVPVISTSDNRGYKLALTIDDMEEARHTWAELSSRMEELEARIKPLIRFLEK
jgi:hypothetical protein